MEEHEVSRVAFSAIVGELETDSLAAGDEVISVFALIKARGENDEIVWAGRSGGVPFSSDELLGALMGLADSIRNDLADDWDW